MHTVNNSLLTLPCRRGVFVCVCLFVFWGVGVVGGRGTYSSSFFLLQYDVRGVDLGVK